MRYLTRLIKLPCLLAMLLVSMTASCAEFVLGINDITSPAFTARGIRLVLPINGSADLQLASFKIQQREFRNIRVHCATFTLSSVKVACSHGHLDAIPGATLEFFYEFAAQRMKFELTAAGGESWQVTGQLGERAWQVLVLLHNAQGKRIAALLPPEMPQFNQGMLNGTVKVGGDAFGADAVSADIQLADAGFSDISGLHAAEKLRGGVAFTAKRRGAEWNWQGNIAWQSGELFWQPLYLRGGSGLSASGSFDGHIINIEQAAVDLPEVGRVQLTASWDVQQDSLQEGSFSGDKLALDKLFDGYAKPFMGKGALAEAALSGHADVAGQYRNGSLQSLRLVLHDMGVIDAAQRYKLLGVNSEIDWRSAGPGTANIVFAGGTLLGAPIGKGQWMVQMNGLDFTVPQAALPVLDGKLELRDLHLYRTEGAWRWQFSASLLPISMEQFTQVAGWPKMLGMLAGRIPRVSYDGREISVDGALLFNVFDGTVVATQLKLNDAFGRAPRLSGNLLMRNLDLDLLTRTFSFGNMQGRLDADVDNLQLQDWQPTRFDAKVYSSAGSYPKKISQKAVQNISALGGAGAAAAIQRSYLSFFENFGYDRIGLSCVLRNGVCMMGGIEESSKGAYAIIKGGGIPAISVMGYNRTVSWGELITRLKRVTQGNAKPIIE
jgi:hypothetical protein